MTAPNFFHCAPKTGSTTLYYLFSKHRNVCVARGKEPNFYCDDDYYAKGARFFWSDRFTHYRNERIAGDFSTLYLADYSSRYGQGGLFRKSLQRIFDTRSPSRTYFSTCIRHPVMWHWSHYLHRVRNVDGFRALPPVTGTFSDYLKEDHALGHLTTLSAQVGLLKKIYGGVGARRNLLLMVYERDVGPDLSIAYSKICSLLSIDPGDFEPIEQIVSSERGESDEVVAEWSGPGTFAKVKANRAYLPAVYRAGASGESRRGEAFSTGDIIIERDADHITVVRDPDEEALRKYLGYYDRVSTDVTAEDIAAFADLYFKDDIAGLTRHLGGNIPEWDVSRLSVPEIERVTPTYV